MGNLKELTKVITELKAEVQRLQLENEKLRKIQDSRDS